MPRSFLMRWEGDPNYRWSKTLRGKRYRVTCDDLGVPRNKEDSDQAANEWWRNKLAELQAVRIDRDPTESRNLATAYPQRVMEMRDIIMQVAPEKATGQKKLDKKQLGF